MTHDDIIRWFSRFRHDEKYRDERGAHTVPIACLCDWAGVQRQHLYNILHKEVQLSENYRARLEQAIQAVIAGLRWKRNGQVWEIVNPKKFEKLPRMGTRRAA